MGTFTVPIQVGDLHGRHLIEVEALVDTGASHTFLPLEVMTQFGVEPVERVSFQVTYDSIVDYVEGDARVRVNDRERTTRVVFGPEGVSPLLGATALEMFHPAVDPLNQRLVPVRGLLK